MIEEFLRFIGMVIVFVLAILLTFLIGGYHV
jgi:hypothetical protein